MRVPLNKIADMAKLGATTVKQSDDPVRVAVIVDDTATPFLIQTVRDAFVPQTTSAIVRVSRIADFDAALKRDTDIVLVLTCGSDALQDAVQRIVIAGAPVAVLCESSVEVPFIEQDTKMLGLVSATDETTLLETLARWILDHTEKQTAFAANFPSCALPPQIVLSPRVCSPIWRRVPSSLFRGLIIPLWWRPKSA